MVKIKKVKKKMSIWGKIIPLLLLGALITAVSQHAIADKQERIGALISTIEEATGHEVEWIDCTEQYCEGTLIITYPAWEEGKKITMKIYSNQLRANEYYNIYGLDPQKNGITNYFIDKKYVITSDDKVSYDEFIIVQEALKKVLPHQY